MYEVLKQSPLFKGITIDEVGVLINAESHVLREYDKGQTIVWRGDRCDNLMIVLSGCVRGEMSDYSGKVLKIEDMRPPQALAPAFLFGENNDFPVNVVAAEFSSILILPRTSVLAIMQKNRIFLTNFLNFMSNRAKFLSDRIWLLSFKTLREKISQYLLEQSKGGEVVKLSGSQQELADYFGVARPSFARALGEMQAEGLIMVDRRTVRLLKRELLVYITR
jgi:CRP-like cAMP-binding protein